MARAIQQRCRFVSFRVDAQSCDDVIEYGFDLELDGAWLMVDDAT
jgi:hypothetical protein